MTKRLNILLINPYTPLFVKHRDRSIPSGLLYLASFLEKNNYNVKFIDVNNILLKTKFKDELSSKDNYLSKFIEEIDSFKPDLIGMGCLFSGRFKPALRLSQIIKKKYSNVPIVFGGIHPTIFPKEILEDCSSIDYIILGEGEHSFLELIKAHFSDKEKLKNIDGLAFRNKKQIIVNPKMKFIENLDDLPYPAYHLLNLKEYYFNTSDWYNPKKLPINVSLPIISSRSCPNQCTFCSMFLVHGKKFRLRSPKNVVDEIEYLYRKYNHRYFSFMDDNFTFSRKRAIEIAKEIIKRKLNIQFDTPNGTSIKTLDKELIGFLIKAGLIRLCVAPESGSEFIRNKAIKKGLSTAAIYRFINFIKDYPQVHVKAFFVIGYPEETKETLEETYQMIKKIKPFIKQVSVFNVVPFPGTPLFEYCQKKDLINLSLDELCKSNILSNYNKSDHVFIKPYQLEIKDLIKFRKKVYNLMK